MKISQFTAVLLSLSVLLASSVQGIQAKEFDDVDRKRSEHSAIFYLSEQNIFRGQADSNRFDPEGLLNRAEWPTLMTRYKNVDPSPNDFGLCFPDVTVEWFAAAVCYAKEQEWVTGYTAGPLAGQYGPENNLNLAEVLVMTARLFDWPIEAGPEWFSGAYAYAIEANVIAPGTPVDQLVTRAQAAEILFRAIAIQEYNVATYDPFIAELLVPPTSTTEPDTGPDEDPDIPLPRITLTRFADQPDESSVASGATYVPVLRFQIETDRAVILDELRVRRISVGLTEDIAFARLFFNGKLIKEGPFSGEKEHVVWRNLNYELDPGQVLLAEMNIDFVEDAGSDLFYQFQLSPKNVTFEDPVEIIGEPVEGEVFRVVSIPAKKVTITNPSKAIKLPFVESENQVIGRFDITAGDHDLLIKRIRLEDDGDVSLNHYSNIRLTVGSTEVATLQSFERNIFDFLVRDYFLESDRTRTFTVRADIGSARINDNVRVYMEDPEHLHAFDFEFGFGVRVDNQFDKDLAWCGGVESPECPAEGLRKRCSKQDIEDEVRDCEEDKEENDVPEECDDRLAPVCGLNTSSSPETFFNRCFAEKEGAINIIPGPCEGQSFVCTADYAPVCGELNGQQQTFSNQCQANVAGASNTTDGECEK